MVEILLGFLESIEPFKVMLMLLPLIGYLAVFSVIRLSGRALVTTGGRDIAALSVAISGFLAIGPAELFFPTAAAAMFGPVVWAALAAFYALSVSLIALSSAPKIVVYGRTPEELYEPLLAAARQVDDSAVGNEGALQVSLPKAGVRLRVDGPRSLDHSQVLAFEPNLSLRFWNHLLRSLRQQVQMQSTPMTRRGFGMLLVALLLSGILTWQSLQNGELVVEGFREWLWR